MSRRTDALRAMAAQSSSPTEAAIAADKLRNAEALEAAARPESFWERRRRYEAERDAADRLLVEAHIAEIVRRWERGGFDGLTVRSGATVDRAWSGS